MLPREQLFQSLQDLTALKALIGTTEHLYLDCKVWPQMEKEALRVLAKSFCGFANAEGGVVVIGMEARTGPHRGDPDVIQQTLPVADALAVKSRIESLVGQLVEPGLEGVQVAAVYDPPGSRSGYVLIDIPPTDGLPCRSRKQRDFYVRISSGTYPMEYFQIADMFGKRRRPVLKLYLEEGRMTRSFEGQSPMAERMFIIGVENCGRGLAKFPSLRFKPTPGINISPYGIDGNGGFGLPRRPTEPAWMVFGGGGDHVIYPGTILKIAQFTQREKRIAGETVFAEYTITAELAAEDVPSASDSKTLPEKKMP